MRPSLWRFVLYLVLFNIIFGFTNLGTDFILCYPGNACREPVGFPIPPASHFNGQIILTSTWATTGDGSKLERDMDKGIHYTAQFGNDG